MVLQGSYEDHLGDIMLLNKEAMPPCVPPATDGHDDGIEQDGSAERAEEPAQRQDGGQQHADAPRGAQPCTVHLRGQTDKVLTFKRVVATA